MSRLWSDIANCMQAQKEFVISLDSSGSNVRMTYTVQHTDTEVSR